jgi:hypothetical protein
MMRTEEREGVKQNDASRAGQGKTKHGMAWQRNKTMHYANHNRPQQIATDHCLTSAAVLALPLAVPPLGKEEASRCASPAGGQNVPWKGVLTVRSCHVRYRTYSVQLRMIMNVSS